MITIDEGKFAQRRFARLLRLAQRITPQLVGKFQDLWYPRLIAYSDAEIEQIFNALKSSPAKISKSAAKTSWTSYLRANNLIQDKPSDESVATALVNLAIEVGLRLWHDPENNPWATLVFDNHCEHHPLKTKAVKRYLAHLYYKQENKVVYGQGIQDALQLLEAKAVFEGEMHPTFVRIAEYNGNIYLDLANEKWDVIEITVNGWSIQTNESVPVRFRRPKGLLPLPAPTRGGKLDDLKPLFNLEDTNDGSDSKQRQWHLLIAYLIGCLRGRGPFPVLVLNGEQGSGKSTAARILRKLIDPNVAPLRTLPKNQHDLVISANNSYLQSFDNISGFGIEMSDALCRLATGGGLAKRELFTDSDETLIDVMRPTILNGIEELVKKQDLVDRAILVTLPSISEDKRKPESELWAQFEQVRAGVLGALLDIVVTALRNYPTTELKRLPRLADFAIWVTAAESALDWTREHFVKIFDETRKTLIKDALESEPFVEALLEYMADKNEWKGTSGELLTLLSNAKGYDDTKNYPRDGPKRRKVYRVCYGVCHLLFVLKAWWLLVCGVLVMPDLGTLAKQHQNKPKNWLMISRHNCHKIAETPLRTVFLNVTVQTQLTSQ